MMGRAANCYAMELLSKELNGLIKENYKYASFILHAFICHYDIMWGGVMLVKRILIVDDTAFMRLSLRAMLERNGFEVIGEAENGSVAVNKYKELRPDIVTMDITMPVMDGIQALKEIRQFDSNSKVVMISALGQESYVREAVMLGAKGFVIKPFKEDYVIKTLNKLLQF